MFIFRSFKEQRLIFIILLCLVSIRFYHSRFGKNIHKKELLKIDTILQSQIDSIKENELKKTPFPFNPNYLTDWKGYSLNLSLEELDRLFSFRKKGKFINSVKQFQQVTKVSNQWIEEYSPYFKFPDWVIKNDKKAKQTIIKKELNTASAEELKKINGIGEVLSKRIVAYRTKLQGFYVFSQLNEVHGLKKEVIKSLSKQFEIKSPPSIQKIKIGEVTLDDLKKIPYLSPKERRKVLFLRTKNRTLTLENIKEDLSLDSLKMERLSFYLY